MKRWEFFFETEEAHAHTVRVIASNIEKAKSLATAHLGTEKFHQISVQTFFEPGCEFHTVEEEPAPKQKPAPLPAPVRWNETVNEVFEPWWKRKECK